MDRNFTLVIAAAGNGSRMNSPIPKGLVEIDNLTLIEISTSNLLSAACEVVVVIQESQEHFFRTKLPQTFLSRIKFVYQDGLNGTLGALCCALPHCNINNDIILMWADHIGLYNLNFSD